MTLLKNIVWAFCNVSWDWTESALDFTRSFVSSRTSEAWPPCMVVLYSFSTSSQYLWFSHSGLPCLPFLLFFWHMYRGNSLPCPPCVCRASGSVCWGCSKLLKQVVQLAVSHLTDQKNQLSSCCSLWWEHCIILVALMGFSWNLHELIYLGDCFLAWSRCTGIEWLRKPLGGVWVGRNWHQIKSYFNRSNSGTRTGPSNLDCWVCEN